MAGTFVAHQARTRVQGCTPCPHSTATSTRAHPAAISRATFVTDGTDSDTGTFDSSANGRRVECIADGLVATGSALCAGTNASGAGIASDAFRVYQWGRANYLRRMNPGTWVSR